MTGPINNPIDNSSPRPRLDVWNADQQDLWIEMLSQFADTLLRSEVEDKCGNATAEGLSQCIRLAAELADVAVREVEYRFYIQTKRPQKAQSKQRKPQGKRQQR